MLLLQIEHYSTALPGLLQLTAIPVGICWRLHGPLMGIVSCAMHVYCSSLIRSSCCTDLRTLSAVEDMS